MCGKDAAVPLSSSTHTLKPQSHILSFGSAFDVRLTKAPTAKAPFTVCFFFNAQCVLSSHEKITFWVCRVFQSEADICFICLSILLSGSSSQTH